MAPFETALIAGSFALGLSHAFEVDHMTAVSAFIATKPRPRQAAVFGTKWAIGHGISLLLLGSVLFLLKLAISPTLEALFERLVGVALLALGLWTLYRIRRDSRHGHAHAHSHDHPHPHGPEAGHDHHHSHHGPIWMGLLHGVAGTAAFIGQAIAVASSSYAVVVTYTLAFSVGVLVAMATFAGALGAVLARAGRAAQILMALWACLVGMVWMLRLV